MISLCPSTIRRSRAGMESRMAWITTSWDDGHPLDLRLAEMLAEHELPGTFYIPPKSQRPTMHTAQVRQLSQHFEIGAHTLDHAMLTELPSSEARRQIVQSKAWVEDVTGKPCRIFCPPVGRFGAEHLTMIAEAGFAAIRTVELLSLDAPRRQDGLFILPTTLQAHPHARQAYMRNALKRKSIGNLWRCLRHSACPDWPRLAASLMEDAIRTGGVFHLWGHSWEIDENAQWDNLEQVLRMLGNCVRQHRAQAAINSALCDAPPVGQAIA